MENVNETNPKNHEDIQVDYDLQQNQYTLRVSGGDFSLSPARMNVLHGRMSMALGIVDPADWKPVFENTPEDRAVESVYHSSGRVASSSMLGFARACVANYRRARGGIGPSAQETPPPPRAERHYIDPTPTTIREKWAEEDRALAVLVARARGMDVGGKWSLLFDILFFMARK